MLFLLCYVGFILRISGVGQSMTTIEKNDENDTKMRYHTVMMGKSGVTTVMTQQEHTIMS